MAPKRFVLLMRRELPVDADSLEPPQWPSGVACRTLRDDDARAAHTLLASAYWQGGGGVPDFRRWWSQLRKDAEFDPALCFVAADAQGLVGVAQCWTSAFVKDLAVAERARRKGLGRALMLTAFRAFAERGAWAVSLKVKEENAGALALYKDLGMEIVARERG